ESSAVASSDHRFSPDGRQVLLGVASSDPESYIGVAVEVVERFYKSIPGVRDRFRTTSWPRAWNAPLIVCTVTTNRPAGALYLLDVTTGKPRPVVLDSRAIILDNLAFSPDNRLLALMRSDCTMGLMCTASGAMVRTLGRGDGPMSAPPVFTPDGRI